MLNPPLFLRRPNNLDIDDFYGRIKVNCTFSLLRRPDTLVNGDFYGKPSLS